MMVSVKGASAAILSGSLVALASAEGTSPARRTNPLRESLGSGRALSLTVFFAEVAVPPKSGLLITPLNGDSANRSFGKSVVLLFLPKEAREDGGPPRFKSAPIR